MFPIQSAVSALVLIAASPLFAPITARGSDVDELRERAANMHREVAELIEHGREREAAELRMEAKALLQQAVRLQNQQRDSQRSRIIDSLEERLQDLQNEERKLEKLGGDEERLDDIRSEIARVRRQLVEDAERRRDPDDHEPPELARRMEHMRIAIEHLEQAGLHDEARHIARRAEEMEHRMHWVHRHHGEQHGEIARALEEVRNEVRRLRVQVDDLIDPRSSIGRESARRSDRRKVERDPQRRRTSRQRDPEPDQGDKNIRGRDQQEKEN